MSEFTTRSAFAEAAKVYLKTGLGNPIPLPVGQKHPVPSGYTSDDGKVVTDSQIDEWIAAGRFGRDKKTGRPHIIGNVGIHLTETVVGIDIDDYPVLKKDGTPKLDKGGNPVIKSGGETIAALEAAHGALPETYISTARDPGVSGIHLFRVSPGVQAEFSGIAGPGIDVIRKRHRYMVVAPSQHSGTGTEYQWSGLDIKTGSDWPSIDQIPDLPKAWVEHLLAKGRCSCGIGGTKPTKETATDKGQSEERETMFRSPSEAAEALERSLDDGMNRHDVATTVTMALVRFEELGRAGATEELERLRELFVDALDGERDEDPGDEWDRMVDGARNLVEESPSEATTAQPPAKRRRLRLYSAADVRIEKVDWLEPGRVPLGSITVVVGFGGLGKSTWTCDLGARTTRGETKGDLAGEPGGVVILSTEDAWENIIKPRLIAANADLSPVLWVGVEDADEEHPDPEALSMPEDIDVLEEAIGEWEDRTGNKVRLIIFDPLIGVISDSVDSHRDQDSRRSLDPMSAMARRRKLAILGIMHFNKKDTTDVRLRISASTAFYNAMRSVLVWGTPPDSTDDDPLRILALEKHNYTGPQPSLAYELHSTTVETGNPELPLVETLRIEGTGLSAVKPDELLKSNKTADTKIGRAKEIIVEMWETAGQGVPQTTVHIEGDKAGIGSRTMLRALKDLKGEPVKDGFGGPSIWTPPDGFFPAGS